MGSELLNGSEAQVEQKTCTLKIGRFPYKLQYTLHKFLIFLNYITIFFSQWTYDDL